jgi:hypothetical protein
MDKIGISERSVRWKAVVAVRNGMVKIMAAEG